MNYIYKQLERSILRCEAFSVLTPKQVKVIDRAISGDKMNCPIKTMTSLLILSASIDLSIRKLCKITKTYYSRFVVLYINQKQLRICYIGLHLNLGFSARHEMNLMRENSNSSFNSFNLK